MGLPWGWSFEDAPTKRPAPASRRLVTWRGQAAILRAGDPRLTSSPTPRRKHLLGRRLALLAGLALLPPLAKAGCFAACRTDPAALLRGEELADLHARQAYLLRVTLGPEPGGALVPADPLFAGEWRLVALSMTAAATANLAFAEPASRDAAARSLERLVERALAPDVRAFDAGRWGVDPLADLPSLRGHAGYLGHLGVMLGAEALLGGTAHEALRRDVTAALEARVAASPTAHLETYPGETYTADNAVVQAALGVADLVDGSDSHRGSIARFRNYSEAKLRDPATGLLVFAVGFSGEPQGGARGSGAGWSSFYLPLADGELARSQRSALLRHFLFRLPTGTLAIREVSEGASFAGDVDSGPVILGASPAGTGFGVAAARLEGDVATLGGLLDTAELVGTTVEWGGERRYLLAPLVGDAILLAMKSATPWDRRFLAR